MTLLFVRHGIRGVDLSNFDSLPTLSSGENLTFQGHRDSNKLGRLIRKELGKPDLIYTDVSDSRTVDTAISLARGAHCHEIWVHNGDRDPYLKRNPIVNKKNLEHANRKIIDLEPLLLPLKEKVEHLLPNLKLSPMTYLSAKGKVKGLLNELEKVYTLSMFCQLSDYHWQRRITGRLGSYQNPDCLTQRLDLTKTMSMSIEYPTPEAINVNGQELLDGIMTLLQQNKLSVVVGHDTNLWLISTFLGKTYRANGYGKGTIPPNSGFIFKIKRNKVKIDYLYLTFHQEWEKKKYLTIPLDKDADHKFDLKKLNVIS